MRKPNKCPTDINLRVAQYRDGEESFRTTLEGLVLTASPFADPFERLHGEQMAFLLAWVFSNLQLRGEKLEYSMRSPFDLMVNRATYEDWLGD